MRPSVAEAIGAISDVIGVVDLNLADCLWRLDTFIEPPRTSVAKKDVAKFRVYAAKLRDKYKDVPPLAMSFDAVVKRFDPDALTGPHPNFDMLKWICVHFAKATLDSAGKPYGALLRQVAGLFYWYATGVMDAELDYHCRKITKRM